MKMKKSMPLDSIFKGSKAKTYAIIKDIVRACEDPDINESTKLLAEETLKVLLELDQEQDPTWN
tara:strand:+ start:449 stop:640 length:192 start_codon:yes stop_codon:yes gene_type:complete